MSRTTTAPDTARARTDRRTHDRLLAALMVVTLAVIYAETWLRLNDLLPTIQLQVLGLPIGAPELLFGGGVALGLGGTLLLALTAPPATARREAREEDEVARATATAGADRREGSGVRRRPALAEA